MKVLALYSLAAALYVSGGAFMKWSDGLTRTLPTLALLGCFAAGALVQAWAMKHDALAPSYIIVLGLEAMLAVIAGRLLFAEQMSVKLISGVVLVVGGIVLLRTP